MKIVFIGYDRAHAARLAQKVGEGDILALDKELEWELERLGVSFISGERYKRISIENITLASRILDVLEAPTYAFLAYRGVRLLELCAFKMQIFFQDFLYYAHIFKQLEDEGYERSFLCAPLQIASLEDNTLLHWESAAPRRALEFIYKDRAGMLGNTTIAASAPARTATEVFFKFFNILVGLLPRRKLRILVSDHWRNIAPLFNVLPEAELGMYERSEFRAVPFFSLLRHRMRFVHPNSRLTPLQRTQTAEAAGALRSHWQEVRSQVASVALPATLPPLGPVPAALLDDLLAFQLPRMLAEIELTNNFLQRERPELILLRTTLGAQWHYTILAGLGRELGIPVVEIQHGLEIFMEGSYSRGRRSEYFAAYGNLIKKEMEAAGQPTAVSAVGSPRLEALRALPRQTHEGLEILCIAADTTFLALYDTYEVFRYFKTVAVAAKAVGARVTIKLRPGSLWQSFYREAIERSFAEVPYVIAQEEPLSALAARADVAVSCFSTASLELMVLGVPVVLGAFSSVDEASLRAHFSPYVAAGAVRQAYTAEDLLGAVQALSQPALAQAQREAANQFLQTEFLFDGKVAERVAALIHTIAKR